MSSAHPRDGEAEARISQAGTQAFFTTKDTKFTKAFVSFVNFVALFSTRVSRSRP